MVRTSFTCSITFHISSEEPLIYLYRLIYTYKSLDLHVHFHCTIEIDTSTSTGTKSSIGKIQFWYIRIEDHLYVVRPSIDLLCKIVIRWPKTRRYYIEVCVCPATIYASGHIQESYVEDTCYWRLDIRQITNGTVDYEGSILKKLKHCHVRKSD